MKLMDTEVGPDREDEVGPYEDDEEYQPETESVQSAYESERSSSHSRSNSSNYTPIWPQSYRQSMDIFTTLNTPGLSFLSGNSFSGVNSALSSIYKRRQSSHLQADDSLTKYLIPDTDKDHPPTSIVPVKPPQPKYTPKLSITDLPPPQQHCSFYQSVLNGINVLCGVGLLTTPYAVKEGGWLSLLLLLFLGIICCFTGIILQRCLESSPGLQTYPDIGQAAFGTPGRLVIAIFLYIELYAACVEYMIMMVDNLSTLFPDAYVNFAGLHLTSHQVFAVIATLILLPTVWLRNLTLLSYLSVGGVITTGVVVICLVCAGVGQVGFHPSGSALNLAGLPVTVGIYGFCYSGHSVFPNIYSSMGDTSGFTGVLIISFIFCTIFYTGVAVCGFLMFGDSTNSQFTLNMPTKLMTSKVAVWATVVIPLTKYALTLAPIALSLEELVPSPNLQSYSVAIVIRTILVFSNLVVALTVPYFGFVMSLIGSLLAMLIAVIFPCACYLSILRGRLTKSMIAVCLFMIMVGTVSACIGTYSALTRIADKI